MEKRIRSKGVLNAKPTENPKELGDPMLLLADIQLLLNRDPLSQIARKARRNVLIWAALSIVVAQAGFVPSEIVALGIKFTGIQQQWILYILGAMVLFTSLEFYVHESHSNVVRSIEHLKLFFELQTAKRGWKENKWSNPLGPNMAVAADKGLIGGQLAGDAMADFGRRALVDIYGTRAIALAALAAIIRRLWF